MNINQSVTYKSVYLELRNIFNFDAHVIRLFSLLSSETEKF